MSVTVSWQGSNCIRYQFTGNWDWNQLAEAYREGRALERASGRRIDVIIDMQTEKNLGLGSGQFITSNTFIYNLLQKNRGIRTPARAAS